MRLYRKMDTTKLLKRWITICLEKPKRLVIHTTKLLDTLFYMQSEWWKLWDMQTDDVVDSKGMLREWEILFYYK